MMETPAEGTDLAALRERYVSVTPLRLDRTNEAFSEALSATQKKRLAGSPDEAKRNPGQ